MPALVSRTSGIQQGGTSLPSTCRRPSQAGVASQRNKAAKRLAPAGSAKGEGDAETDFVTRLVGSLFGKKALEDPEPFGLKRLSDTALQELYPATTTEFAEPVDGDDATVALFRPLLAKTQLEQTPLRCAYDATKHGWSAAAFHERVDTFGAAVVFCTTEGGAVVGGYNPKGWVGLGDSRDSQAAFLFSWPDGNTSNPAVKLPKVGGAGQAVLDKPDSGPLFGPEGFHVPLARGAERLARCRLGSYYAKPQGGGRTLFSEAESTGKRGNYAAQLTDLKVYVAVGEGEKWDLDGILWKTNVQA